MDDLVKRRLVGAVVLALLAAVLLPWMFGDPKDPRSSIQASFSGTPLPGSTPRPAATPTARAVARITPEPRPREAVARPKPAARAIPDPTATPRPTATPTPAPPASGWVLQLASYKRKPAAESFRQRLSKDGYQAYTQTVTIKGTEYYRVRMGLSMSRREAEQLQRKLEKRYRLQAQLLAAR